MTVPEIIQILLANRSLSDKKLIDDFFSPPRPDTLPLTLLNLDSKDISRAITLIKTHMDQKNPIYIYGDYDVDGITGTAILWENLHSVYPDVFPHIPDRRGEGYGLSQKGIDHCLSQGAKLIITVDNGIAALDQIAYSESRGCDVIVIDHHEKGPKLPPAKVIIHSTATCAAGLAWFFCREFDKTFDKLNDQLSLVALAVVCDLVPLLGLNRSLVKYGLEEINRTSRPGIKALIELSGIKKSPEAKLTTYHLGFILGPRLNSMGRLENAIDSLRLLCTRDPQRARLLATNLNDTNQKRRQLTEDSTINATSQVTNNQLTDLLVVADPEYDQGVIGLVAARLVEKYHRPAIAVSVGETECKASARSVPGFNITGCLQGFSRLFTSVGGHSMAAGFSFPTRNLNEIKTLLSQVVVPPEFLIKKQRFDVQIPLNIISPDLWIQLERFAPFGLGNFEPLFFTPGINLSSVNWVGNSGLHLKFFASDEDTSLPAIWFSPPKDLVLQEYSRVNMYYRLQLNTFRDRQTLQLAVKELTKA